MNNRNFWQEKIMWKENGDIAGTSRKCVRINGSHYLVAPEDEKGMRGFGGSKFHIRWIEGPFKGQEAITTNLWHQGEIPVFLRSQLPDNAEWVKGEPIGGSYAFPSQKCDE